MRKKFRVFGSDTDRDFSKISTDPIRKPDDPIRKVRIYEKFGYPKSSDIRKFRIGFGSQFPRSEIFGYPNFRTGSDPISDIEHPYLAHPHLPLCSPGKCSIVHDLLLGIKIHLRSHQVIYDVIILKLNH